MGKRRPSPSYTVEVEHNGKRHQAIYTISGDVVEVHYGMATNRALTGGQGAEILASVLLREILEGNKWQI